MSPNEVEEMYLNRAEDLVELWAEDSGGGPGDGSSKPMTAAEIASTFGGHIVSGGGRGG